MTVYGFNQDDAKRIGRVVRLVEADPTKVRLSGSGGDGAAPGVRLLIGKVAASSWATATTALVTIYNGDPGSVVSAATVVAYNHFVKFSADSNCTNRWVSLGHNGFGWHPVDSVSDCGTCVHEVGAVDFRVLPGYQRTAVQIIGHDANGCMKWVDVTTCATT